MKIAFHYLLRLVVIGLVGGGPLKGTRGRAARSAWSAHATREELSSTRKCQ